MEKIMSRSAEGANSDRRIDLFRAFSACWRPRGLILGRRPGLLHFRAFGALNAGLAFFHRSLFRLVRYHFARWLDDHSTIDTDVLALDRHFFAGGHRDWQVIEKTLSVDRRHTA